MKSGWAGIATMVALGVLAAEAHAQGEREPQGLRFWAGTSLANRETNLGRQVFSSAGLTQDISRSKNGSLEIYADAFRVVAQPVAVVARKKTNDVLGAGVARVFTTTDKAGVGTFYGVGVGYYRSRLQDTQPGVANRTVYSVGGKLFAGTSLDGPFFLQGQVTLFKDTSDIQLGVGARF